ncbi:MAG: hypothetical protein HY719_00810, partial [Planctomycetes bacterium]|nr:hypothetical protein [Planctomycetota bacterium]
MAASDERFAQEAIKRGHVTPREVAAAQKAQKQAREAGGAAPTLRDVLVRQKAISPEDAARVEAVVGGQQQAPEIPVYEVIKA